MDYVTLISLPVSFVLGALFRGYLNKKGENLATKQDIDEITHKVEQAKSEYTERLEEIKQQNRFLLGHVQYKNQLRLAALDRRLEVHQQAYALLENFRTQEASQQKIAE